MTPKGSAEVIPGPAFTTPSTRAMWWGREIRKRFVVRLEADNERTRLPRVPAGNGSFVGVPPAEFESASPP